MKTTKDHCHFKTTTLIDFRLSNPSESLPRNRKYTSDIPGNTWSRFVVVEMINQSEDYFGATTLIYVGVIDLSRQVCCLKGIPGAPRPYILLEPTAHLYLTLLVSGTPVVPKWVKNSAKVGAQGARPVLSRMQGKPVWNVAQSGLLCLMEHFIETGAKGGC